MSLLPRRYQREQLAEHHQGQIRLARSISANIVRPLFRCRRVLQGRAIFGQGLPAPVIRGPPDRVAEHPGRFHDLAKALGVPLFLVVGVVEDGQQAVHARDDEGVRMPIHLQDRMVIGLPASVHVRPQQVVARAVGPPQKSLVRPFEDPRREKPQSVEAASSSSPRRR